MTKFDAERSCPPGDAAKFWGLLGFAGQAEYGQLGRIAMRPWKQRQSTDEPPWSLSHTMERSMSFIRMLLHVKPRRSVPIAPDHRPSLVVASDAQVEPGSYPGGGVLCVDPAAGTQLAPWHVFSEAQLQQWDLCMADLEAGRQRSPCARPR